MKKEVKYACAFGAGFLICPCPVHGTALGLALVGTLKGAGFLTRKQKSDSKEESDGN